MIPDVGEIWREVDPRFDRFVRIVSVSSSRSANIRTVIKDGDGWIDDPRGYASTAHPRRFNGKRGGYELIAEARHE